MLRPYVSWHKEQQGFVTLAINSNDTDYLNFAYLQALTIKKTQKINRTAVIIDQQTKNSITDKHKQAFDYIIELKDWSNNHNAFSAEPLIFWHSPFKETIKLEADLILTRSIDHWWRILRLKNLVLANGCKNYLQHDSDNRKYRKIFDENALPDIYNGLMYFRYSAESHRFFTLARQIFENWSAVASVLKFCDNTIPSTDLVYSLCAHVIGKENVTLPRVKHFNFVHLKPAINQYNEMYNIEDVFLTEFDHGMMRINNINQYHPVHLFNKNFDIQQLINIYESS